MQRLKQNLSQKQIDVCDNTLMLSRLDNIFKSHNTWLNSDDRGEKRMVGRKKKKPTKKDKATTIEMHPEHVKMAKFGLLRELNYET